MLYLEFGVKEKEEKKEKKGEKTPPKPEKKPQNTTANYPKSLFLFKIEG